MWLSPVSFFMIIPNTNAILIIRKMTNFWGNYRPSKAVPSHLSDVLFFQAGQESTRIGIPDATLPRPSPLYLENRRNFFYSIKKNLWFWFNAQRVLTRVSASALLLVSHIVKVPVLFLHALECVMDVSKASNLNTRYFLHITTHEQGKDLALLHMKYATAVRSIDAGAQWSCHWLRCDCGRIWPVCYDTQAMYHIVHIPRFWYYCCETGLAKRLLYKVMLS